MVCAAFAYCTVRKKSAMLRALTRNLFAQSLNIRGSIPYLVAS
jgi:hypothetical protein